VNRPRRLRRPLPAVAATIVLGTTVAFAQGCQMFRGSDGARVPVERLDRSTGTTLGTAPRPMLFARTEARYSRSNRDYIYLGPVETNRQGLREYYLWVGVATTLDRGYLAPELELPVSVQLQVQGGEPMLFELSPWAQAIPGLSPANAYPTQVALRGQLGARATRDQLRLIADAAPTSIRIGTSDGATRIYDLWEREPVDWTPLLGRAN
jgi:hypothetical protein